MRLYCIRVVNKTKSYDDYFMVISMTFFRFYFMKMSHTTHDIMRDDKTEIVILV